MQKIFTLLAVLSSTVALADNARVVCGVGYAGSFSTLVESIKKGEEDLNRKLSQNQSNSKTSAPSMHILKDGSNQYTTICVTVEPK